MVPAPVPVERGGLGRGWVGVGAAAGLLMVAQHASARFVQSLIYGLTDAA